MKEIKEAQKTLEQIFKAKIQMMSGNVSNRQNWRLVSVALLALFQEMRQNQLKSSVLIN